MCIRDRDGKVCASTLVAAKEAGADEIYKVGGAQAIGALAFGTESIPKVEMCIRDRQQRVLWRL